MLTSSKAIEALTAEFHLFFHFCEGNPIRQHFRWPSLERLQKNMTLWIDMDMEYETRPSDI
jgi:hypothetical protein